MSELRILDVPSEPPVGTTIEYDSRLIVRVAEDDETYPRDNHQDEQARWREGGPESYGPWWTWGEVIGQAIDQATGGRYVERRPS